MTINAIKDHVLRDHEKRVDFKCEYCGKEFPSFVEINRHVRSECVISKYLLSPFLTSCTLPMCLHSPLLKAKSLLHLSQWKSNSFSITDNGYGCSTPFFA